MTISKKSRYIVAAVAATGLLAASTVVVFGQISGNSSTDPQPSPSTFAAGGTERPDLLSWNVFDAREISPGVIRANLRAKWVRYLDSDGSFKVIDTALTSTSEGWCMSKAPFQVCFPFPSTGTAVLRDNNRFDAKSRSQRLYPDATLT
jgi:hypothetical protein